MSSGYSAGTNELSKFKINLKKTTIQLLFHKVPKVTEEYQVNLIRALPNSRFKPMFTDFKLRALILHQC
jgi:hypothetical protein